MKKTILLLATAFASLSVSAQQPASTADSIKNWVTFLASDQMKGRANGSVEIERTAEWLAEKFGQYGMRPIGGMDGFVQPYILDDDSFVHKNVIGCIPAGNESDNDGPVLVISAHFDHIGAKQDSADADTIFNGADDDASGIVTMLAIAKNIFEGQLRPDIPIVFAAFSNEERGFRGSDYFCKSGVLPMQRIKADINLEMLGRSHEFGQNRYLITGPEHSNFHDIVVDFNKDKDWKIANIDSRILSALFRASDNYSFAEQAHRVGDCVPAHTIATSLGFNHIHKVDDETEYIDFENLSNVADNLTQLVLYVAGRDVDIQCN